MPPSPRPDRRPLLPHRVRRLPAEGFSWIDRRFVREGHVERLDPQEVLLYLFLVCVADRFGLSWWGDRRISFTLKLAPDDLDRARDRLVERGLIAWRAPLYQVLDLSPPQPPPPRPRGPSLIGEILRGMAATAASPEAPGSSALTAG